MAKGKLKGGHTRLQRRSLWAILEPWSKIQLVIVIQGFLIFTQFIKSYAEQEL